MRVYGGRPNEAPGDVRGLGHPPGAPSTPVMEP